MSDEVKGSGQFQVSGLGTLRGVLFLLTVAGISVTIWFFSGSDANRKIKLTFEFEESRPEKFKQPQPEKPIDVAPDKKNEQRAVAAITEDKPKTQIPPRAPFYYEIPPGMSLGEQKRFKRLCPIGFDMPEVCFMPWKNRVSIPVYPDR